MRLDVLIRILRQAILLPAIFGLLMACTCKAIKPCLSTVSITKEADCPFINVLMLLPMHSIRTLLNSLNLKAFCAAGFNDKGYNHSRRASSYTPPVQRRVEGSSSN